MKAAQLLSHDYVRAGRVLKLGLAAVGVAACFAMTGCYNSVFDETSLQQSGARQPIEVQSEQVTVKQEVVDCAVDAGLFDQARLTRNLERAYRTAFRRYVDGKPPERAGGARRGGVARLPLKCP